MKTGMRTLRTAAAVVLAVGAAVVIAVTVAPHRAAAFGPVQQSRLLGYSVRHRPIVAYRLGTPGLPKVLVIGQIHGDEHAGVTLAQSFVHAGRSVEGIDLWVVPTMNPDGDAAHTRQNAHDVDLNRNWPDKWVHLDPPYYSGPRPLSEPETRAMYSFLQWLKPHYVVVLHQPLYGVDTTDGGALDKPFRDALAHNLGLPEKAFRCWSICHGSLTGWYTTQHLGIGETIEFGSHPTTAYLTTRARDGILAAAHGHWDWLYHHNPWSAITVTGHRTGARVTGWAFDPDAKGTPVTYSITDNGRLHATYRTMHASPEVNARYGLTGTHAYSFWLPLSAGRHQVCLIYRNQGAGSRDPSKCRTVLIPG